MNYQRIAEDVVRALNVRGVGHTYAALHGVNNSDNARLIVSCERDAKIFGLTRDKSVSMQNMKSTVGTQAPVVLDNRAAAELLSGLTREIRRLKEKVRRLEKAQ